MQRYRERLQEGKSHSTDAGRKQVEGSIYRLKRLFTYIVFDESVLLFGQIEYFFCKINEAISSFFFHAF